MPNQARRDPTRTTVLRRNFMADMTRRFKKISKAIEELVVNDDAFGLEESTQLILSQQTTNQQVERQVWRFQTDAQKVKSYRRWLKRQINAEILTVEPGFGGRPWTAPYIESAYRKGALRAFTDLRAEQLAAEPTIFRGGREEFIRQAFGQPEALHKIELLYERAFTELEGVTAAMDQQMSRILANGLSQGHGPRRIARDLRNNVTKITNTRALVIARTETIAAHAEGQLDAFERLGVKEVGVVVEWLTAGDDRVCAECEELEGVIMTIDEARGLIPRHPNCRCAWIPADKVRREAGQLRGRQRDKAVDRSIRSEGGVDTETGRFKESLRDTRRGSTWVGKEL